MKTWVDALRSGKYKQGKSVLNESNYYCCLGVLCEIQGRPKSFAGSSISYDDDTRILSFANPLFPVLGNVGGWNYHGCPQPVECRLISPTTGASSYVDTVARLNDVGVPFNVIADVIETLWFDPEQP